VNKLVPAPPLPQLAGEEIEVIIRYRGQEFIATQGKVESVSIHRDVDSYSDGFMYHHYLTGMESLTINLRREREKQRVEG
jgi:hypothetical protein